MAHQFYIAAAHKSSGKTTISTGLCRVLADNGHHVLPFKKGPDYIDPIWLGAAARHPCHNLDFNTQEPDELLTMFSNGDGAIRLVEGNKGLFDGIDIAGSDSNAALAFLLDIPVVLVVDTVGMTRGIAPLLQGYQQFAHPQVRFAGVILNKVGGARHENKLRQAVEHYTDIPVLGAVHRHPDLIIDERHLGLAPANEVGGAEHKIHDVATLVRQSVDWGRLLSQTEAAVRPSPVAPLITPRYPVTIGIARDAAFGFYYQSDLDMFRALGARLRPFSILEDTALPQMDGLFLGGGFPETHARQIADNTAMLADLRHKIEAGLPTYAECGGLMILANTLRWQDIHLPMAGIIAADCVMNPKPQGRGYVAITPNAHHPWATPDQRIQAHEFHYSTLINFEQDYPFAYTMQRGAGMHKGQDGLIYRNLLASYTHLRATRQHNWVEDFLSFVGKIVA
jgi:cobyrinic acid a,c-diamide synthase